jgi:hypothetical protein
VKIFKSADEKQRIAEAEATLREIAASLTTSDPDQTRRIVAKIQGNQALAVLQPRERRKLGEEAFVQYANNVLADDHVTEDEEDALSALAEAVGFEQADFNRHNLNARLQVAKLNDGRLPVLASSQLMPKRGEIVHIETSAALMKEVAVREWRGGSQGVSFRIAKGVRYRVGSTRGRVVTVGTQLQIADTGILAVTNQRAAFLGSRKTIDMPYAKLIGMHMYIDAISFSLSNRQNAPLIKVTVNTDVLAALLNAAVQQSGQSHSERPVA